MTILCVMRIPPHPEGHGGSQRAWQLVRALRTLGSVHFVLVSRKVDHDAATVSLAPLERLVESVVHIDVPEWQPHFGRRFRLLSAGWVDLFGMRSAEAPRISRRGLEPIAAQLPIRDPDVLFAGRLPSAVMIQSLLDRHLLTASRKVADFDDIMSRFVETELRVARARLGKQGYLLRRIDLEFIRRAERRIATQWDGVSVCTDEDAGTLRNLYPGAGVTKIPNIVERAELPIAATSDRVRILFVGNLCFLPNVEGLLKFIKEGWATVLRALPNAQLTIVGINPEEGLRALARDNGFSLYADVPSVEPFYRDADLVIAPILRGGGTRIKILEAMAYGRPVVSTPVGASGLDVVNGRDILLADEMPDFANAIIALARDPALRQSVASNARALQQREYSPKALDWAVERMVVKAVPARST